MKDNFDANSNTAVRFEPELVALDPKDPSVLKIRLAINTLLPDRTQYKPYGIEYSPEFWVEVTVTSNMIVEFTAHYVVLTPAGIAHVADQLATALDSMHDEFRNRNRSF